MVKENKKKHWKGRFALYGLLFLLLFALPGVHASTGQVIGNSSITAFEGAFGGPGLFVMFFFVVVAFIEGFFQIPWAIAIELYLVTFAMTSAILGAAGAFNVQILELIWVFIFTSIGFAMTKLFADLIFA